MRHALDDEKRLDAQNLEVLRKYLYLWPPKAEPPATR